MSQGEMLDKLDKIQQWLANDVWGEHGGKIGNEAYHYLNVITEIKEGFMKYEMDAELATNLIRAYQEKLVFNVDRAEVKVFHPGDYRGRFTMSRSKYLEMLPLFKKHSDATYGSIFPTCYSLTELGYKYAKYWLAYAELDEVLADDPTESLPT
jgi:hypothetical protein